MAVGKTAGHTAALAWLSTKAKKPSPHRPIPGTGSAPPAPRRCRFGIRRTKHQSKIFPPTGTSTCMTAVAPRSATARVCSLVWSGASARHQGGGVANNPPIATRERIGRDRPVCMRIRSSSYAQNFDCDWPGLSFGAHGARLPPHACVGIRSDWATPMRSFLATIVLWGCIWAGRAATPREEPKFDGEALRVAFIGPEPPAVWAVRLLLPRAHDCPAPPSASLPRRAPAAPLARS